MPQLRVRGKRPTDLRRLLSGDLSGVWNAPGVERGSRNGLRSRLRSSIWILTAEMLNKNSSTFRIFLSSCHPEQARPTKEEGRRRRACPERSRRNHENVSSAMQHQGVLTKTPLNSLASVAPFAVKFQISLSSKPKWQTLFLMQRTI